MDERQAAEHDNMERRRTKWEAAKEERLHGDDPEWEKRLKKAMHYAKGSPLFLDRGERLELAKMLPNVDPEFSGSWKELNTKQLDSLLNMLEGWIFITYLLDNREDHSNV